jgi:hypothetical protein
VGPARPAGELAGKGIWVKDEGMSTVLDAVRAARSLSGASVTPASHVALFG